MSTCAKLPLPTLFALLDETRCAWVCVCGGVWGGGIPSPLPLVNFLADEVRRRREGTAKWQPKVKRWTFRLCCGNQSPIQLLKYDSEMAWLALFCGFGKWASISSLSCIFPDIRRSPLLSCIRPQETHTAASPSSPFLQKKRKQQQQMPMATKIVADFPAVFF